jgi:L-2,4-diaminobutyric acid acetyltransferase
MIAILDPGISKLMAQDARVSGSNGGLDDAVTRRLVLNRSRGVMNFPLSDKAAGGPEATLEQLGEYALDPDVYAEIGQPQGGEGADIERLAHRCPPLVGMTTYAYMLLCPHFSKTCVVARRRDDLLGFILANTPPGSEDTLFVWQMAVSPDARCKGLATMMLRQLLQRRHLRHIRYLEATVTPSNGAPRKLFAGFAEELGARYEMKMGFSKNMFKSGEHEDEYLFRIGPIDFNEPPRDSRHFELRGINGRLLHTLMPSRLLKS